MKAERTLTGYIEAVSQPSPAPGAGSVAAVAGSLGCALGEMVCGITIGNSKIEPDHRLLSAFGKLTECRVGLMKLAIQDEEAYGQFREAQVLPKGNVSEKQARSEAMAATLAWATEVPLSIAETGATALEALSAVARHGSKHALADVTTAAYTLHASIQGALENVRVNLRMMKDPATIELLRQRSDDVRYRGSQALTNLLAGTEARAPSQ